MLDISTSKLLIWPCYLLLCSLISACRKFKKYSFNFCLEESVYVFFMLKLIGTCFMGQHIWAAHIVHFMNIKIQTTLVVTFHKCQLSQIVSGAIEISSVVNNVVYVRYYSR